MYIKDSDICIGVHYQSYHQSINMGIQPEKHSSRKSLFIVVVCMITITDVVDVSLWVSQPSSSVNDESVENTNQTLCVYLKQFRLSENKKVSVCYRRCCLC